LEKLRVTEALLARDQAIYQMESVCASSRKKDATIAALKQEKENLEAKLASRTTLSSVSKTNSTDSDGRHETDVEAAVKLESLTLSPDAAHINMVVASVLIA
jgi:hypothetical protein